MARRGDTKPLCQRAQAGVACIGASLLPLSDGKNTSFVPRSLPPIFRPLFLESLLDVRGFVEGSPDMHIA